MLAAVQGQGQGEQGHQGQQGEHHHFSFLTVRLGSISGIRAIRASILTSHYRQPEVVPSLAAGPARSSNCARAVGSS